MATQIWISFIKISARNGSNFRFSSFGKKGKKSTVICSLLWCATKGYAAWYARNLYALKIEFVDFPFFLDIFSSVHGCSTRGHFRLHLEAASSLTWHAHEGLYAFWPHGAWEYLCADFSCIRLLRKAASLPLSHAYLLQVIDMLLSLSFSLSPFIYALVGHSRNSSRILSGSIEDRQPIGSCEKCKRFEFARHR